MVRMCAFIDHSFKPSVDHPSLLPFNHALFIAVRPSDPCERVNCVSSLFINPYTIRSLPHRPFIAPEFSTHHRLGLRHSTNSPSHPSFINHSFLIYSFINHISWANKYSTNEWIYNDRQFPCVHSLSMHSCISIIHSPPYAAERIYVRPRWTPRWFQWISVPTELDQLELKLWRECWRSCLFVESEFMLSE